MKKRIITVVLSVMALSVCTGIFVSAGEKAKAFEMNEQKIESIEDVDVVPESCSDVEVTAEQTAEDAAMTADQIVEDLTAHVWEGTAGDEHYSIVFESGSDNFARYEITDPEGAFIGGGMSSWELEGNKITMVKDGDDVTAEYSSSSLVFENEKGDECQKQTIVHA